MGILLEDGFVCWEGYGVGSVIFIFIKFILVMGFWTVEEWSSFGG